ncbi:TolC family protein [Ferrimonas balearica]|uniref:TolC family protein n=1 Tax=Ferrimonas balearica TaxID=44012 RepID=UPI001C975B74|nr:TolC family protein [Ferrimonas balearica]MBY6105803.1 TolC family protein [Ferrimonas balearica]
MFTKNRSRVPQFGSLKRLWRPQGNRCGGIALWLISAVGVVWGAPVRADTVSLSAVMEQTLLHHPQLQLFPHQQRIAEAQALQAGIRPNPNLSLSVENVLGSGEASGFSGAETTLAISQLIELGGKRQRRIELADAQQREMQQSYEQQRVEVLAEATRRYYRLLHVQTLLDWSERRMALEQDALQRIQARSRAGAVQQADVSGMALQLAESQLQHRQLQRQAELARYRLAAMWAAEPRFERAQGKLRQPETVPALAAVLDAANQAPQHLLLLEQGYAAAAQSRLAEANGQWDLNLGVGVKRDEASNDTGLVFSLDVPLQLSHPNQGNLLAARMAEQQLAQQQQLLRGELRVQLMAVYQSLQAQTDKVTALDHTLLPLAQQWLQQVQKAYQTGQQNVQSLLAAQSRQFELERQRIDALHAIWLQLLELERLTGQALAPSSSSLETES